MDNDLNNKESKYLTIQKYLNLPLPKGKCQATYVWIDGSGENLRSKDKTLDFMPKSANDIPLFYFDGNSTYQANLAYTDTYLHPIAMYKNPFVHHEDSLLVLCETFCFNGTPTASNRRSSCKKVVDLCKDHDTWFGIEQEYTLFGKNGHPYGWPANGFPAPQGLYYCSVGANKANGRFIVDAHYRACMFAGIQMCGTNAEVMPSQWEFQVGPRDGISVADDLWMARYILHRITEEYGIVVNFDPKPVAGNWNGSGAHTNVSTSLMRKPGGIDEIKKAIQLLSLNHSEHIKVYDPNGGRDNGRRLIGSHETSALKEFSSGVGNRASSIRIPRSVCDLGYGYFEDRRPSSNCDPYRVVEIILRTMCLQEHPGNVTNVNKDN